MAGRTLDVAEALALEAFTGHIGVMREAGKTVLAPSTLDKAINDPQFQDGVALLASIKEPASLSSGWPRARVPSSFPTCGTARHLIEMSPEEFIAGWRGTARIERSAAQEHFSICALASRSTKACRRGAARHPNTPSRNRPGRSVTAPASPMFGSGNGTRVLSKRPCASSLLPKKGHHVIKVLGQ
jgi:hypothetical protein